ncbi:MAG: Mitochondrial inner membrane protein oxa1 [Alectoria sarmentosa]|nr:MAG: Mitochondrial inner membrane protein oxa1 [Alectoria sarmentosa]
MIQARCLHRSGHRLTNSSGTLASSPQSGPKFYSAFAGATSRHKFATNSSIRPQKPRQLRQWPPQPLNGNLVRRFASTTPTPPIAEVQSDYVLPPQTSAPTGEEFLSTSLDEVTSSIPPPVYEHLGFLKEMGLDYGWGPTAFVETLLEHVHVYLGTPWWASIGISMLIIRAALVKFYIDAADSSARRQLIKNIEEPIVARIKVAQAERNQRALREAWYERSALRKSAGIIWWKSFGPFLQLPIGFGTFRLMRGMAYLPVPGLDAGGLLWMPDLTQSDPYFILPIATAVAYYFTFKKGGETGSNDLVSKRTQQVFLYVIPPFSGFIMMFWPGGLQLTFFISAMISGTQAALFRSAWFRNLVGIQPLPDSAAPKPQSKTYSATLNRYQAPSSTPSTSDTPKGIFGNIKGAVSDIMKLGEKFSGRQGQTSRLTDGEKKHAHTYEQKRKREIARDAEMKRGSAQAKFERQQEQEATEQERKQRLQRRAEKKIKQIK